MTTTIRRRLAFGTALAAAVGLTLAGLGMTSAAHATEEPAGPAYTTALFEVQGGDWTLPQRFVASAPVADLEAFADVVECGTDYQVDVYRGDLAAVEVLWKADGYLHYAHDGGFLAYELPYTPYRLFTTADCAPEPEEPPYVAPVLECGEWELPGRLNEHGDPTACVSNHPCPHLEAPACIPTEEENPWNPEPTDPPTVPTEPSAPSEPVPSSPMPEPGEQDTPSAPAEPATVQLSMLTPPSEVSTGHGRTALPATGISADPLGVYALLGVLAAGLGVILATTGLIVSRRRRLIDERLERIANGDERSPLFD